MAEVNLIFSVLAAVIVHELGHIIAMRLLGVRHGGVSPRFFGLGIDADLSGVSYTKELAVFAAGSLADIVLALCLFNFPEAAVTAVAYGVFNLLPTHFLDGGEILRLILMICGAGERAVVRVLTVSTYSVTLAVWIIAVYLALSGAGTAMLVTAVYMMFISSKQGGT